MSASSCLWSAGSSPRGRGKRDVRTRQMPAVRLIPARAGKTRQATKRAQPSRAHPRAGGENTVHEAVNGLLQGSSPRGRGKHSANPVEDARAGLIPARAGKTPKVVSRYSSRAAHPRAGGENRRPPPFHREKSGSSPRGRGKHHGPARHRRITRLIPARAGKTTHQSRRTGTHPAHPRAGGENG